MDVRINVLYTSMCHSDLVFWEAKGHTPLFPRIFGHEAAGIVESVGDGVTELQEGDHVLPVFTGECQECRNCKSEDGNLCELLRIDTERGVMITDGNSRFTIKGSPIYHFVGTSTFSEYTVVHVGCVAKINPAAPLDKVCLLSCGISTGMGAAMNVAKPKKGSTVAVFGLGTVGLAAAEGARIAGASRIIGVDVNPSRFERAKLFGVTEFVNSQDCSKPVQQDGGVAVLVGVPCDDAVFLTSPTKFLFGRTLKGTFFGNFKPRSQLPGLVEMYLRKEIEIEKFITHEVSLAEINKAFQFMIEGQSLRCIIHMNS